MQQITLANTLAIDASFQALDSLMKAQQTMCLLVNANTLSISQANALAQQHLQAAEYATFSARRAIQAKKEFVTSRLLIKSFALRFLQQHKPLASHLSLSDFQVYFDEQTLSLQLAYAKQALPLNICISHSGGYVLLYLSTQSFAVGVDIEKYKAKRDILTLAEHFYHPFETALVKQAGDSAFYRLWTLKEALAKASKLGVGDLLAQNTASRLMPYQTCSGVFSLPDEDALYDISIVASQAGTINSVYLCHWADIADLFL